MSASGDMNAVAALLAAARRVLVVSHSEPDGDALGSALGLGRILADLGKDVWVHSRGPVPEEYRFLTQAQELKDQPPAEDWPEAAVVLDCHQSQRVGREAGDLVARLPRVAVVDHHQGQSELGQAVWIDPGHAATAQMVADLAEAQDWPVAPGAANCLLTGLMTDTGSFRYANADAAVFRCAAWLVEQGADVWGVSQEVYATRPKRLQLLALVMDHMTLHADGRLAVSQCGLADFQRVGAAPADLEQAVEALRGLAGVEVAALIKERPDGSLKASLRSRSQVDVAAVAMAHGGGGHRRAAGMTLEPPLGEARASLTRELEALLAERR